MTWYITLVRHKFPCAAVLWDGSKLNTVYVYTIVYLFSIFVIACHVYIKKLFWSKPSFIEYQLTEVKADDKNHECNEDRDDPASSDGEIKTELEPEAETPRLPKYPNQGKEFIHP